MALAIHLFALAIGVACTALTGLVVVTFDEKTTEAWIIATAVAVATDWLLEPFKTLTVVLVVSSVKTWLCSTTRRLDVIQNMATMARVAAAMGAPGQQPDRGGVDETREPQNVMERALDFEAVERLAICRGFLNVSTEWVRVSSIQRNTQRRA